jgi:hypothetical protein
MGFCILKQYGLLLRNNTRNYLFLYHLFVLYIKNNIKKKCVILLYYQTMYLVCKFYNPDKELELTELMELNMYKSPDERTQFRVLKFSSNLEEANGFALDLAVDHNVNNDVIQLIPTTGYSQHDYTVKKIFTTAINSRKHQWIFVVVNFNKFDIFKGIAPVPVTSVPVTPVPVTPVPVTPVPVTPVPVTPVSVTPVSVTPVSVTPVSVTPVTKTPVPVSVKPVSVTPDSVSISRLTHLILLTTILNPLIFFITKKIWM